MPGRFGDQRKRRNRAVVLFPLLSLLDWNRFPMSDEGLKKGHWQSNILFVLDKHVVLLLIINY